MKEAHVIGNGKSAYNFKQSSQGFKMTCNVPPFEVPGSHGSAIVDFKMMKAITEGSVQVPAPWILGARPKIWMEKNPAFYMRAAPIIKEFYLVLPPYAQNYTKFSCGHFATHYTANKVKPDVIHMYGFDSMFDFDLTSTSDMILESNRDNMNTTRLTNDWRSIWPHLFAEFPDIEFIIHYKHRGIKFPIPENVKIDVV